ncbi:hypothetical protein C8J56DRAFT_900295 [Mycena floridula]|nr:hypothetical protein C8J56DRAFT_900295 [Mycena floridula]
MNGSGHDPSQVLEPQDSFPLTTAVVSTLPDQVPVLPVVQIAHLKRGSVAEADDTDLVNKVRIVSKAYDDVDFRDLRSHKDRQLTEAQKAWRQLEDQVQNMQNFYYAERDGYRCEIGQEFEQTGPGPFMEPGLNPADFNHSNNSSSTCSDRSYPAGKKAKGKGKPKNNKISQENQAVSRKYMNNLIGFEGPDHCIVAHYIANHCNRIPVNKYALCTKEIEERFLDRIKTLKNIIRKAERNLVDAEDDPFVLQQEADAQKSIERKAHRSNERRKEIHKMRLKLATELVQHHNGPKHDLWGLVLLMVDKLGPQGESSNESKGEGEKKFIVHTQEWRSGELLSLLHFLDTHQSHYSKYGNGPAGNTL